jgi:hypothetical protein
MRQQYHRRLVGEERHWWDINRLIDEIKHLPVIDVPLSEIKELDTPYWHEEGGWRKPIARDLALHAMLMYESNLDFPIILHADGELMDGMHRVCKALILGHKTIKAIKFETDPPPHFINPGRLPYGDGFNAVLQRFGLPYKE